MTTPARKHLSGGHRFGRWAVLCFVGWLGAVGAGFGILSSYAAAPGEVGAAPLRWPASSVLTTPAGSARLVVFIHPRCPCTRATVAELARLLARAPAPCSATAVIYEPSAAPADWSDTAVCGSAASIPDVDVVADIDGVEARRFGASTSGHVVLYSATGELLFCGGITSARGHEGDNAGRDAILAALAAGAPQAQTPVFGCALVESCGGGRGMDQCQQSP